MWKSVLKTLLGVRVDIVLDTNETKDVALTASCLNNLLRPFDSVQVKLSVHD